MIRCRGFDVARAFAEERREAWGVSVVDLWYYVGPVAELDKLPVVVKGNYAPREADKIRTARKERTP